VTFQIADFAGQVRLNTMIHHAYANAATELAAIATALGSDPTTHDTTIQSAPVALMPGLPGHSRFTNDILAVVNAGKGGNLTNAQMAAAINAGLASEFPPVNSVAPSVSGTGTVGQVLTCAPGTWSNSPTTYGYAWLRNGIVIGGAAASTYTLVAGDSGTNASCRVTATNPAGTAGPVTSSNAIAVA
jgi:hypothetical protein